MGALDCVSTGKMQTTESTEVFSINMSSNSTLYEKRRDVEGQATRNGNSRRHSIWWAALVDLPLFLIILVFIGLMELGFLPNYQGGFYCGDPALSFPFNGDTVTAATLVTGIFLIPLIVILPTEIIFAEEEYLFGKFTASLRKMLLLYRNYIYGVSFNLVIVEIMKIITGSPRPTFFDLCEPDKAKTCNGSEFVSSFTCTSTKYSAWIQQDSYHSFPSGHTSLAVHCAIFVAWYLQIRAFDWRHRTVLVVPMVQLLGFTFATTAALTRITDHRHHWWDVLVGFIIGVTTAFYSAAVLSKRFTSPQEEHSRLERSVKRLLYTNDSSTP